MLIIFVVGAIVGLSASALLFKVIEIAKGKNKGESKIEIPKVKEEKWYVEIFEKWIEKNRLYFDVFSIIVFTIFLTILGYNIPQPDFLLKIGVLASSTLVGIIVGFIGGEILYSAIVLHKNVAFLEKCNLAAIPASVQNMDEKAEKIIQRFILGYVHFFIDKIFSTTNELLDAKEAGAIKSVSINFQQYKEITMDFIDNAHYSLYSTCSYPPSFWFKGDAKTLKDFNDYFMNFQNNEKLDKKRIIITDVRLMDTDWKVDDEKNVKKFINVYNEKVNVRYITLSRAAPVYYGEVLVMDKEIVLLWTPHTFISNGEKIIKSETGCLQIITGNLAVKYCDIFEKDLFPIQELWEYLPYFCWDLIGMNKLENDKLKQFLIDNFQEKWVKQATISKTNDNRTINVVHETKSISLELDDNNKLIKNGRINNNFIGKNENGNLYVFKNIVSNVITVNSK